MLLNINKHVHSFLAAPDLDIYFEYRFFFQNKCLQGKYVQILLGKISAQVSQHLFSLSFMMQSNLSRNSTIIQNPLLIY